MKNFVDNDKLLNNDESGKNSDTNSDVIMVSRRERHKKKNALSYGKEIRGKDIKKIGII